MLNKIKAFIILTTAACLLLAGCGNTKTESGADDNTGKLEWTACATMEDAAKIAGFEFNFPYEESKYDYHIQAYEGMIENTIYINDTYVSFRKSTSLGNISGRIDENLTYMLWKAREENEYSKYDIYVGADSKGKAYACYVTVDGYGYAAASKTPVERADMVRYAYDMIYAATH